MRALYLTLLATGFVACGTPHGNGLSKSPLHQLDQTESTATQVEYSIKSSRSDHAYQVEFENTDFETPRRIHNTHAEIKLLAERPSEWVLQQLASQALSEVYPDLEFRFIESRKGFAFNYLRYQQIFNAKDVISGDVTIRLDDQGNWQMIQAHVVSKKLLETAEAISTPAATSLSPHEELIDERLVYYPHRSGLANNGPSVYLARELQVYNTISDDAYLIWQKASNGELIGYHQASSKLDHLAVKGTIIPDTPEDLITSVFLPFVQFRIGKEKLQADHTGRFDSRNYRQQTGRLVLENDVVAVVNGAEADNGLDIDFANLDSSEINFDDGSSLEERNIYYWVMKAHEHVTQDLGYTGVKKGMVAIAKYGQDLDNAFFQPLFNTLAFGMGNTFLKNTALSRDIVLHEYGHAFTHAIYGLQTSYEFRAMNEAFSDYFAATITDDPLIADGAMRNGMKSLRAVETDYQYPEFAGGISFHRDGQLFSGALWRLRQSIGRELADQMIHEARLSGATTIREFWKSLREIDEALDDGNPFTPSPNREAIRKAFQHHNLHSQAQLAPQQADDITPWNEEAMGCWSGQL